MESRKIIEKDNFGLFVEFFGKLFEQDVENLPASKRRMYLWKQYNESKALNDILIDRLRDIRNRGWTEEGI